jgi:hypothetical protein
MPTAKSDLIIDTPLLRAVHAAAREHGVSRDELHDAIAAGFKLTSLKELTKRQAYALLNGIRGGKESEHFKRLQPRRDAQAFHGRKDFDAASDAIYPATEREHQMLRDAAALRNWDEATLVQFIARQLGKPVVVTLADFNKVFWALKAMNRRSRLHR